MKRIMHMRQKNFILMGGHRFSCDICRNFYFFAFLMTNNENKYVTLPSF